jgi:SAM-dependent methyltransferase
LPIGGANPGSARAPHRFRDDVAVRSAEDPSSVWNEVADLYGEGISPFDFFSAELVKVAALSPGDAVLDLGTGNGLGLIPAAQAVAPAVVVGVDFATQMLEAARQRADRFGVQNIELALMDVAHLDLADATFDVALASSVFQFVGYSTEVLREWRRVLRADGRLVFSVPQIGSDPAMSLIADLIGEHAAKLAPEVLATSRVAQKNRSAHLDLPALCRASGFQRASVSELCLRMTVADVEEWWAIQWTHGIRAFLRAFDDATLDQIKRDAGIRLESLRRADGAIPLTLTMTVCQAT